LAEVTIGNLVCEHADCPICGSNLLSDVLFRKQVPIHQNLLISNHAAAINAPRGDLALEVCQECGFIFNRAFDSKNPLYGEDYENMQGWSPSFNEYVDGLVRHMVEERNVRDCNVVEVGCGNGWFLRKLIKYDGANNRGSGFDPSYNGPASELDCRLKFFTRFYDSNCADARADVVVSRHVIEHLPRPLDLLRDIKKTLAQVASARVFVETPCVEWTLRNQVIWDFYYEHCSYFTAQSLTTAFEIAGFKVEGIRHVFGGQYLWVEATLPAAAPSVSRQGNNIIALAEAFTRAESDLRQGWERKVQSLAARERVAVWGAGAKGVTFASMVDPHACWIDCIVDLNPSKQGHFVPGTGHPIVSHRELSAHGVTSAILMNPNYREENLALLKAAQAEVRLIEEL